MTRKDYEIIAAAFRSAYKSVNPFTDTPQTRQDIKNGICLASIEIADRLAQENPKFNRDTFLDACTTEPKP